MKNSFSYFVSIILLFTMCSKEAAKDSLSSYPQSITIDKASYQSFFSDLLSITDRLDSNQKKLLEDYIKEKNTALEKSKANQRGESVPTGGTQTCDCLSGQTKCSAEGTFSSCCICCSNGVSAVCGVTVGFASCYCNDPKSRDSSNGNPVTVFPQEIIKLINFASENKVDITELRKSLDILLASSK